MSESGFGTPDGFGVDDIIDGNHFIITKDFIFFTKKNK